MSETQYVYVLTESDEEGLVEVIAVYRNKEDAESEKSYAEHHFTETGQVFELNRFELE